MTRYKFMTRRHDLTEKSSVVKEYASEVKMLRLVSNTEYDSEVKMLRLMSKAPAQIGLNWQRFFWHFVTR